MEEDMTEELVLESDRKRSRSQPTQEVSKQNMVKSVEQNAGHDGRDTTSNVAHFLLAGPGGARQGL
jgi:hypothetical protein